MHVSAKADYAVRAAIELAAAPGGPVKGDRIAEAQQIPLKFLENILPAPRPAGYVQSQRGADGGYWLAEPADALTPADIIRAVDGALANGRGGRPEAVGDSGSACGRSGPADAITVADIIRAVDGPLANVRGARPESVEYSGSASHLAEVWIAVRGSLRSVLERVTLADLVAGVLPASVKELTNDADAWVSRSAGGHPPPPPSRRPPRQLQ